MSNKISEKMRGFICDFAGQWIAEKMRGFICDFWKREGSHVILRDNGLLKR
jgi:hypothetical protein